MREFDEVLKKFGNLREFSEFLNDLVEAADGQEIARGMNPNDRSKEEKSKAEGQTEEPTGSTPEEPQTEEAPSEQQQPVEAAEGEAGGEAPTIDPVAAPGSQVSIGKKVESKIHKKPKTKALDVKGSDATVKVDTKPHIDIDPRYL